MKSLTQGLGYWQSHMTSRIADWKSYVLSCGYLMESKDLFYKHFESYQSLEGAGNALIIPTKNAAQKGGFKNYETL